VPAGAMLRVPELRSFDYFRDRGRIEPLYQPELDEPVPVDNLPVRSERLARPPLGPAPKMGGHTREIARELLHLSKLEIDQLLRDGVLEESHT
jgi:crotonobetainyl-CoA:carnitine CoA-transferase CaiB-like acyl-CoA transferase